MDFFKLLDVFVKIDVHMNEWLHGFVQIDTCISLTFYMDLSKLFYLLFALSQT